MLSYLLQGNTVILKEKEAVVTDGGLDLLDKVLNYSWVLRVQQGQINGLQRREVLRLLCDWWWDPLWH